MTAHISTWMRSQPVLAFYLLAFAITWFGWIPHAAHSRGIFPFDSPIFYILGGVGPLVATLILLRVLGSSDAAEELFGSLLRWRVGIIWYAVALFGYAAIWLMALGLSGEVEPELEKVKPLPSMLPVFLLSLLAAVPEEVAWRGFALPRLQARHSALVSSMIVGALWAFWHLPLLLTRGNVMSTYPLIPYFLAVVARAVLYTWMYNSTQSSVLIVTIFHAASNTVGTFIPAEVLVTWVLVAILVIGYGPVRLSRGGARARPQVNQERLLWRV